MNAKSKSKDLVSFNHIGRVWNLVHYMDQKIPPKHGHEDADPLSSLLLVFQDKSRKTLSNNVLKYVQRAYSWTKLRNSSNTHMMNPETHHTFMCDEPRNNILMNTTTFSNIVKNTTIFGSMAC